MEGQPEKLPTLQWEVDPFKLRGWELFFSEGLFTSVRNRNYRAIARQLVARPDSYAQFWSEVPTLWEQHERFGPILANQYEWPNRRFLPHDRIMLVFHEPTWGSMDLLHTIWEVQRTYRVEFKLPTWAGSADEQTYGMFLSALPLLKEVGE